MSELIRALDVSYWCLTSELNESQRRLGDMTIEFENLHNRHSYPSIETTTPYAFTPTDLLLEIYLHLAIRGEHYPILPSRNRYAPLSELRGTMGEPGNLTHPKTPGDTSHPIFYNLPAFPRCCFVRFLYHHEGGGYS